MFILFNTFKIYKTLSFKFILFLLIAYRILTSKSPDPRSSFRPFSADRVVMSFIDHRWRCSRMKYFQF